MIDNILGMGIDTHLLGLRQAARENAISCAVFEDDSFRIANHFALSTSQVNYFTFSQTYLFIIIVVLLIIFYDYLLYILYLMYNTRAV